MPVIRVLLCFTNKTILCLTDYMRQYSGNNLAVSCCDQSRTHTDDQAGGEITQITQDQRDSRDESLQTGFIYILFVC